MKKIMIVDDEEAILEMYKSVLVSNYQVLTVADGETGLATALKERPDLIYLDIIMPKLNGLDVLKKLKERSETAEIPVVMLTNLPQDASADKAKSLGAVDYLVKVENEPNVIAQKTEGYVGK